MHAVAWGLVGVKHRSLGVPSPVLGQRLLLDQLLGRNNPLLFLLVLVIVEAQISVLVRILWL